MARQTNFLLGRGENLTNPISVSGNTGPKAKPYTFDEARTRLLERVQVAAQEIAALPALACPRNRAVAAMTVHPSYVAKTWYPTGLLDALGLEAVGSRPVVIEPEQWGKKRHPDTAISARVFVAGDRTVFAKWADDLPNWQPEGGKEQLDRLEDFEPFKPKERIRPLSSSHESILLEVVLHATDQPESEYVLVGFQRYLRSLGITVDMGRRMHARGLCFLPLRASRVLVPEIAKFSFLRVLREMPTLRELPTTRSAPKTKAFTCLLPDADPIDPTLKVAVFDGGSPNHPKLSRWFRRRKTKELGKADPDYQSHGLAVTSALLFGSLEEGQVAARPYAFVDHYRVLDTHTSAQGPDLHQVLDRILDVLRAGEHTFVNLSIGPDMPCEDDEVTAWTSLLDHQFRRGDVLATIAAGNGGERDAALRMNRIQVPADCVNALAVGACDSRSSIWRRARYSSIGPGRSPGVVKPDVLAFGGSQDEPFWVLDPTDITKSYPQTGTSFASPLALRTALGIRTHLGSYLRPLALKALLVNRSESNGQHVREIGWGRTQSGIEHVITCADDEVTVVFQGRLQAGKFLRAQIPIPAGGLRGNVTITATFCFAALTDPQDPLHYTRSGLEVRFRPHSDRRRDTSQVHANSDPFFQARQYATEQELREDAHKWETTLHRHRTFRAPSLKDPVFDIHYNARAGGQPVSSADEIPYALIVTVRAPSMSDLYNRVVQRYRGRLEPLRPIVPIPVRT